MKLITLRKLTYYTLIPLLVIMPLWVGAGRILFDHNGFMVLFTFYLLMPVLFILQLLTVIFSYKTRKYAVDRQVGVKTSILLTIYYVTGFLTQFFIYELAYKGLGDSIAMDLGLVNEPITIGIMIALFILTLGSLIGALVAASIERSRAKRESLPPQQPATPAPTNSL